MIVEGDAAYGSQENMQMVMQRDTADAARRWGFVFAIARTWKTVEDKAIKDGDPCAAQILSATGYPRLREPRLQNLLGV